MKEQLTTAPELEATTMTSMRKQSAGEKSGSGSQRYRVKKGSMQQSISELEK